MKRDPEASDAETNRLAHAIATTFGLGERVPAPGTVAGSLPAAAGWFFLAIALPDLFPRVLATGALVLVTIAAGLWASGVEAHRRGASDPGPVVVDEVAGQFLTYLIALLFARASVDDHLVLFVAAGFFLFRAGDVAKPWPISRLERLPGAVGIMFDDLGAAVLAGTILGVAMVWLL